MRLDTGFILRNRHEHLGNAVADIVLDDEFQDEEGQEHTDTRINQIQVVVPCAVEPGCQTMMDGLYQCFQKDSGQSAADAHDQ